MIIEKIKSRLRITSADLDDEIQGHIDSAKEEMKRVGINVDETNPLQLTCVEFYAKWLMNFQGEGERYEKHFNQLRNALSNSEGFKERGKK